jgi:hypothetical protein
MLKDRKGIIIILLLVINAAVLFTAPRFGWALRSGAFDEFIYQTSYRYENKTRAVYLMPDQVIEIGYGNRFSRELEIIWNKEDSFTVKIEPDNGIRGEVHLPEEFEFRFAFSDIVWRDSSGLLYYRYIFAALAAFGWLHFARKGGLGVKSFYTYAAGVLFVVSLIISSRVMTLFN